MDPHQNGMQEPEEEALHEQSQEATTADDEWDEVYIGDQGDWSHDEGRFISTGF